MGSFSAASNNLEVCDEDSEAFVTETVMLFLLDVQLSVIYRRLCHKVL